MNLTFRYDAEADILGIGTGRRAYDAAPLAGPELGHIAVDSAEENARAIAGAEIIFVSGYVAPYFRLRREGAPFKAGDPERTRYDRETDTLTWGITTDIPEMVSQAGDLTAYWQPEDDFDADDPFFVPIGLSLRNAAKHLSPWFELVEPAAAG